jgi:hypothetical protein
MIPSRTLGRYLNFIKFRDGKSPLEYIKNHYLSLTSFLRKHPDIFALEKLSDMEYAVHLKSANQLNAFLEDTFDESHYGRNEIKSYSPESYLKKSEINQENFKEHESEDQVRKQEKLDVLRNESFDQSFQDEDSGSAEGNNEQDYIASDNHSFDEAPETGFQEETKLNDPDNLEYRDETQAFKEEDVDERNSSLGENHPLDFINEHDRASEDISHSEDFGEGLFFENSEKQKLRSATSLLNFLREDFPEKSSIVSEALSPLSDENGRFPYIFSRFLLFPLSLIHRYYGARG